MLEFNFIVMKYVGAILYREIVASDGIGLYQKAW